MSKSTATFGQGRRPSVKDVAERAKVSLGTVSNVLNRPDRVSAATRERVERAMADLGFVLNESARQLRMGRSNTFAYVMLDATNPFFTDVARGIELAAEKADLSLFLCNSDGRDAREHAHLAHLQQQRVDGILITPVDPDSPDLARIVRQGTPMVIVDRASETGSFCSVTVDDRLGGRMAVEHLVDRGHTRVAYVGGPDSIGQVRDRLEGARAAWEEAGLPEDYEPLLVPGDGMLRPAELVEDELILAVPVVAMAPGTDAMERDWPADEDEQQQANPFAALAALKQKHEN